MSTRFSRLSGSISVLLLLLASIIVPGSRLWGQGIGILDGIPYVVDQADTAASALLPQLPAEPAGARGFLRAGSSGGFTFEDGTPARFLGVTLRWTAALPDSLEALRLAARLRKLGVNLVRFEYIDNSLDWYEIASVLDRASGFRSLSPERIRRLDWLIHQLEIHGIYTYLPLLSARSPRPEDGISPIDTLYSLGIAEYMLYPGARAAHKLVSRLLLEHVNPYNGRAYRDDPGIALLEIVDKGSLSSFWRANVLNYRPGSGGFSFRHSRRLDTLYADWLRKRYGTTSALSQAWGLPPGTSFPNLIREGGFEGDFDTAWQIISGDGVTTTTIINQGDSTPEGSRYLSVRARGAHGVLANAYMMQQVPLAYNRLYRISLKARTTDPQGTNLLLYSIQTGDGGLYGGLATYLNLTTAWAPYEFTFLVPIESPVPFTVYFFFGERDATISFDDVQIREVAPIGLDIAERIETSTVTRLPWGAANELVSRSRAYDQARFYLETEQDYLSDLRRYVKDTLKARQPLTGAGLYWSSSPLEWRIEHGMDFAIASSGNDYVFNLDGLPALFNFSPLRVGSVGTMANGGVLADVVRHAPARQPFLVTYSHPYPNRYLAESMAFMPAYAALQGYEGVIWDVFADNTTTALPGGIDSLSFYSLAKNPAANILMPVVSQIFRSGALSEATTTIPIRRSLDGALTYPRMERLWGAYGIPGGFTPNVNAIDRVVTDSIDAVYPTRLDDLSLPQVTPGELRSDTRQLFWEYNRGSLTINAPAVQGAVGALTRAGGILTDHMKIDLTSGTETATVLWSTLGDAKRLDSAGRSLLTVTSRTERSGLHWIDTMKIDRWGTGPMLLDPVRARITFRLPYENATVTVTPLDPSGRPAGDPLEVTHDRDEYMVTVDQKRTPSAWFSVEIGGNLSSVAAAESDVRGPMLGTTSDPAIVAATLPAERRSVMAEMIDGLGRRVALLHAGPMKEGRTLLRIGADDIPSGLYLIRLTTERGERATLKLPLAR